jgi:hypothetical protein
MLEDILKKIEELKILGKDSGEMNLWLDIAPTMTDEEQLKLLNNLSEELLILKK